MRSLSKLLRDAVLTRDWPRAAGESRRTQHAAAAATDCPANKHHFPQLVSGTHRRRSRVGTPHTHALKHLPPHAPLPRHRPHYGISPPRHSAAAVSAAVLGAGRSLSADVREYRADPLDRHLDSLLLARDTTLSASDSHSFLLHSTLR